MAEDTSVVLFGSVELKPPDLVNWTTRAAISEIPAARITLSTDSVMLHAVALNESVTVYKDQQRVFTGEVVTARFEEGTLVVDCSSMPQFDTLKMSAFGQVNPTQLMRLVVLEGGGHVVEHDDLNELAYAKNLCTDWDAVVTDLDNSESYASFLGAIDRHFSGKKPSNQEKRTVGTILAAVQREIGRSGMSQAPKADILREHYQAAIPEIWGVTWRFRTRPDAHEFTVPLRGVTAPSKALQVGSVRFIGAQPEIDRLLGENTDPAFRANWKAEAYASTMVEARDMWTARQIGVARVRDAMAAVAFAYCYSPLQQKLGEDRYRTIEYSRPAGPPGFLGSVASVRNTRSDEYLLGSIKSVPSTCDMAGLASTRWHLLSQAAGTDESTELLRHIKRAMNWHCKGLLAETRVDAFLYAWISLEMLFQRPHERTSDLVRRLPFVQLSVGEKPGEIRTEIQRRWVPLRDEIVHRAIQDHPDIEAGIRRIRFFSDCAIGHALELAPALHSFDDWLAHLDSLRQRKPGSA